MMEKFSKLKCEFPMVVDSILPHAEFGPNVHREDATHFNYDAETTKSGGIIVVSVTYLMRMFSNKFIYSKLSICLFRKFFNTIIIDIIFI